MECRSDGMTELKPCPFCGHSIYIKITPMTFHPASNIYWVHDNYNEKRDLFEKGIPVNFCIVDSVHMVFEGKSEEELRQIAENLWNNRVGQIE